MTEFTYILLTILMSLTPYYGDKESGEARSARMEMVAFAIDDATDALMCQDVYKEDDCKAFWKGDRLELGVMLLTLAWHESAFAKHVHENRCDWKRGECDGGRAVSLWQIQKTGHVTRETWWALGHATPRATFLAAYTAGKILAGAYEGCRTWEGAVASYATGRGCKWARAEARVQQYRRLLARAVVAKKAWAVSPWNPAAKAALKKD